MRAKIIEIDKDSITAVFERSSACAGCDNKHDCTLHKCQAQTVTLPVAEPTQYHPGQIIELETNQTTVLIYAYVVPLVLMLTSLFATLYLTKDETISAIIALAILAPYYSALFLLRKSVPLMITVKK